MKNLLILLIYLPLGSFSQSISGSPVNNQTLKERFQTMKSVSQTFKEYKVIKESELDNEWRAVFDSVNGIRNQWHEAKSNVVSLEGQLKNAQIALRQKEESSAKIEYAAAHFDFFGIDFKKAVFAITVVIVVTGLMVLLGMMMGRLKIMFRIMKEKNEMVEMITREFEEYKHKMLDKQSKLSRELQNERNRLQELKRV